MSQDELKQRLSAWMDDEATSDEVCDDVLNDKEARRAFESYHVISAVMKHESSAHWESGFSDKVASALEQEATILAPQRWSQTRKTFTGWAVAASVAMAVVVGVQWYPGESALVEPTALVGTDSVRADSVKNSPVASDTLLAEYHVTPQESEQLERINNIFSRVSQQAALSGSDALPYVRLVSGEQVKTFRMTPQMFRKVMMELERKNREAQLKAQEELGNQP